MNREPPICPYCGNPAKLVDSATVYKGRSYGMIWDCRPCDAYVGCHKNSASHVPLGRLADKELRQWKMKAHQAFDPLWKSGEMKRTVAYRMLREALGVEPRDAHIGMLNVEQCRKLVAHLAARR